MPVFFKIMRETTVIFSDIRSSKNKSIAFVFVNFLWIAFYIYGLFLDFIV